MADLAGGWKKIAKAVNSVANDAHFEGITVKDGHVRHKGESVPLAGARLSVETAGDIDKRVTATRLILTGPFAFGLRKKKDHRELYVTVENAGSAFVVPVDPKLGADARKFAAKVNTLAAQTTPIAAPAESMPPPPPRSTVPPPPPGTAAGWLADPSASAEMRYWDGGAWTEHVATNGEQSTDPL